jgi:hypothetical protein
VAALERVKQDGNEEAKAKAEDALVELSAAAPLCQPPQLHTQTGVIGGMINHDNESEEIEQFSSEDNPPKRARTHRGSDILIIREDDEDPVSDGTGSGAVDDGSSSTLAAGVYI